MNRGARILSVDDESKWRENFERWITEGVAVHDSAATAQEAVELIRRFHYDLILLDLSMDLADSSNRDTRPIREYLATMPEGTRFFVVSAHLKDDEVYKLGD